MIDSTKRCYTLSAELVRPLDKYSGNGLMPLNQEPRTKNQELPSITLNAERWTLNPERWTLNAELWTLNALNVNSVNPLTIFT